MHEVSSCHAKQSRAIRRASGSLGLYAWDSSPGALGSLWEKKPGECEREKPERTGRAEGGLGGWAGNQNTMKSQFYPLKSAKDTSGKVSEASSLRISFLPLTAANRQEKGDLGVS